MLWRPVANFNMVIRDLWRELRVIRFSLYFSKFFSDRSLSINWRRREITPRETN